MFPKKLIAQQYAKKAINVCQTSATQLVEVASNEFDKFQSRNAPLGEENFYVQAIQHCDSIFESILQRDNGISSKIRQAGIGALGSSASAAGLFSLASLGTASTGAAIGGLSGAALNSASLFWIGGSVATGGALVVGAGLATAYGSRHYVAKKLYGKPRTFDSLTAEEFRVVESCRQFSLALNERTKQNGAISPMEAPIILENALQPMHDALLKYDIVSDAMTQKNRKRLEEGIAGFKKCVYFLQNWVMKNPSMSIGVISAVFLKLMAVSSLTFSENEELVLEALRRSNNALSDASVDDLKAYMQDMRPEQLQGLQNNIKGIYHELLYQKNENADGDEYSVELFEDTNHAGADVIITNITTGATEEVQLKATAYSSYIDEHMSKYADIEVLATSEVASENVDVGSTDISNAEIESDVQSSFEELRTEEIDVSDSMAVAAVVSVARNIKLLFADDISTNEKKSKISKNAIEAAAVSGVIFAIVG